MIDYTRAEAGMRRLILIRNHLDVLCRLFECGTAPPLAFHYGSLRLVQFLDAYENFMGSLDSRQREPVLCAAGLVSDVHKHRDALKKVRNGWIAHPPDDGLLAEDASDFIRRVGLPVDLAAYYEMLVCTVIFIDTVRALLPCIAKPAVEKFNRTDDARPKYHCVDLNRVACNVRGRLEVARRRAGRELPGVRWDLLLGAAGVRLDQLGEGGPRTDAVRVGGPCEGGAIRQ